MEDCILLSIFNNLMLWHYLELYLFLLTSFYELLMILIGKR